MEWNSLRKLSLTATESTFWCLLSLLLESEFSHGKLSSSGSSLSEEFAKVRWSASDGCDFLAFLGFGFDDALLDFLGAGLDLVSVCCLEPQGCGVFASVRLTLGWCTNNPDGVEEEGQFFSRADWTEALIKQEDEEPDGCCVVGFVRRTQGTHTSLGPQEGVMNAEIVGSADDEEAEAGAFTILLMLLLEDVGLRWSDSDSSSSSESDSVIHSGVAVVAEGWAFRGTIIHDRSDLSALLDDDISLGLAWATK
jgi:hypothetical protein